MIEDGKNPPLPDEEEKSLSSTIATRLAGFFDDEQSSDRKLFRSVVDPTVRIIIERLVPERRTRDFSELMKSYGMSFPAYSFGIFSDSHLLLLPTPYGILPELVIGADDQVYAFMKEYYFDRKGCSFGRETLAVIEDDGQFDREQLQKLDSTPSEDDEGVVALGAKDYKKVLFHLGLIDSGQFVPYDPSDPGAT